MIRLPESGAKAPSKKEIKFPLVWTYRAVTEADNAATLAGLNGVLQSFGYHESFVESGASSGGKYRSFKAAVTVPDMEKMNAIGDALGKVPGVKFLL